MRNAGRAFYEQELAFPELLSSGAIDDELERHDEERVARKTMIRPYATIRRHSASLADELESLWGYRGFERFVTTLISKPPQMPVDLLHALLALLDHHELHSGEIASLGSIRDAVEDRMGRSETIQRRSSAAPTADRPQVWNPENAA